MSDSEVLGAYRQTVAQLKEQKLQVAAAKTILEQYAEKLTRAAKTVSSFAADPLNVQAVGVREALHEVAGNSKDSLIDELEDAANKVRLLESRVAEFRAGLES